MKPPPRPPDKMTQNDRQINLDLDLEINQDFEENSPYQEGIISEIYQTREITTGRTTRTSRFSQYRQDSSEIFAKTDRYG